MANLLYRMLGVIDNLTAIRQSVAGREHLLIRPFNQAILMYPTAILGLWGFAFVEWFGVAPEAFARVYLWTLLVNNMILFFDLRFGKTVIILFALVIAGFVLHSWGVLGDVARFLGQLSPSMNGMFYLLVTVIWAITFLFVWIDRRSFVIVVEPNHVVIHDKWIGEAQSYPTENVAFSKEIGDALELLLGFGTLKITNANNGQMIRAVPHVFRISGALDEIKRVTAQFQVENRPAAGA
ncbi:MAG: hypothetical protein HY812_02315 [Planctomycetes bacterium]|nr:hypothetical protein [Planctomycetota bacterium]